MPRMHRLRVRITSPATRAVHCYTPALFKKSLQIVRVSGRDQVFLHIVAFRSLEFPFHTGMNTEKPVTGRDKNVVSCLPGRALLLSTDVAREVFPVGLSLVKNEGFNVGHASLHRVGLQGVPDVLLHLFERMIILQRQNSSAEADDELLLPDIN